MGYLRQIAPFANFVTASVLASFAAIFGYRWIVLGQSPVSVAAGIKATIFLIAASVAIGWIAGIGDSLQRRLRQSK